MLFADAINKLGTTLISMGLSQKHSMMICESFRSQSFKQQGYNMWDNIPYDDIDPSHFITSYLLWGDTVEGTEYWSDMKHELYYYGSYADYGEVYVLGSYTTRKKGKPPDFIKTPVHHIEIYD